MVATAEPGFKVGAGSNASVEGDAVRTDAPAGAAIQLAASAIRLKQLPGDAIRRNGDRQGQRAPCVPVAARARRA